MAGPFPSASALLLLLLLCRATPPASASAQQQRLDHDGTEGKADKESVGRRRKILSFGGNGMLGTATLLRLIHGDDGGGGGGGSGGNESQYDITLVSRGSWPFDSHQLIAPHVKAITCDRGLGDLRRNCPELASEVDSTDEYYAVLDFSGYSPSWVENVVELLGHTTTVRVYIYVSTDSVYEVSELPSATEEGGLPNDQYALRPDETGRRIREVDAVRPVDPTRRAQLNARDEYGNDKWAGEEILVEQRQNAGARSDGGGGKGGGFPHVSLRFADVVGHRDASYRFAIYWMWIRLLGLEKGAADDLVPALHVPENVVEATSITYVEDGAAAILAAMERPESWDEAYNIACEEVFNVTAVLGRMCELMGIDVVDVERREYFYDEEDSDEDEQDEVFTFYPSVTRGALDITKARTRLGFAPTPLDVVLRRTIDWHEGQFRRDEEFREELVEDYFLDLVDEEDQDDVYGIVMSEFKKKGAGPDHDEL